VNLPPAPKATILVVDDVPANIGALGEALEGAGYRVLAARSGEAALKSALKAPPDLILLDVHMPGQDGLETCRRLKAGPRTSACPVIFLTANDSAECLVGGLKAGGVDYITKPFQVEEVLARVAVHLQLHRLRRELEKRNSDLASANERLTAEIRKREQAEDALRETDEKLSFLTEEEARRWGLAGLIGRSGPFGQLVRDLRRVQEFPRTNVLLHGESGTGKELIARAIHFGSPSAHQPFIPVNCSALPEQLAESLMFGHTRGAFTGAVADRKGYFEMANGGTLFLDEIGDMPLALQAKLLRVLEDGEVTPLGAIRPVSVRVRIIAATHVDLPRKIADGHFRQDLYFRLMHFNLTLAPLRARRDDIPALAVHFIHRFATEMNRHSPALHAGALERLLAYSYPGNIRELKNTIERAIIHTEGDQILARHIHFLPAGESKPAAALSLAPEPALESLPYNLAEAEEILIARAVQAAGGNISAAARLLGVNRVWIYRRAKLAEARTAA
jgi:DNA-binding NtrC family response regulator